MTVTARTAARTLLVTCMLTAAACSSAASSPPPPPARPAPNPFQASVTAKAYTLTLVADHARPGTRGGSAAAAITIAAARDRLCWKITRLRGVPGPRFAYIHRGSHGTAGPVVLALGARYQPAGCVIGVPPALLARFEAVPGDFYLAVHNAADPQGAVRGQL